MIHWQNLELGDDAPRKAKAVIEVPKGTRIKLAVDHEKGFLELKDVLQSPMPWPCHYGFFPRTVGTDEDPLDVLLVASFDLPPLVVVDVRPVGAVDVDYPNKGLERKLIGVCPDDPVFGKAQDLKDLAEEKIEEIRLFYETFVTADKRDLKVVKFVEHAAARAALEEAMGRFRKKKRAA